MALKTATNSWKPTDKGGAQAEMLTFEAKEQICLLSSHLACTGDLQVQISRSQKLGRET